jgi:hypothetical protein
MGNPLSKPIEDLAAFQAGFRGYLPALRYALYSYIALQIAIFALLVVTVILLLALLITMNPDLAEERKRLVTRPLKSFLNVRQPRVPLPRESTARFEQYSEHGDQGYRRKRRDRE